MYMHAHLRYCEALARFGDAKGFFRALCQINPSAIRELVPSATPPQANCYYSSSDAAFADCYVAFTDYDEVNRGEVALEGGWRVYSSGAGISKRLIMQCFLGLRLEKSALVVDPVIPLELDGLRVCLNLAGHLLEVVYRTGKTGRGPVSIDLNGTPLEFVRETNAYRLAGVRIPADVWTEPLTDQPNRLTISLE